VSLQVNEIFYSIQGESTYTGLPCVFVRLTGCNLRCSYCDTQYAYHEGQESKIHEIIGKVRAFQCPLVEITGGEPLLQDETPDLTHQLLENDFHVLLETNGSQDISVVDDRCVRILDIKCPSSGEQYQNDFGNLKRIIATDEIKFVIGNAEDYSFAKEILNNTISGSVEMSTIIFSPVFGEMDPRVLSEWILKDHLPVRMQIQLHKVIWDPNQRGV